MNEGLNRNQTLRLGEFEATKFPPEKALSLSLRSDVYDSRFPSDLPWRAVADYYETESEPRFVYERQGVEWHHYTDSDNLYETEVPLLFLRTFTSTAYDNEGNAIVTSQEKELLVRMGEEFFEIFLKLYAQSGERAFRYLYTNYYKSKANQ